MGALGACELYERLESKPNVVYVELVLCCLHKLVDHAFGQSKVQSHVFCLFAACKHLKSPAQAVVISCLSRNDGCCLANITGCHERGAQGRRGSFCALCDVVGGRYIRTPYGIALYPSRI